MPQLPRLYTFAVSHFSEKVRWTLDAMEMPYEEVSWTPLLHIGLARRKSRRSTTVPILEADGQVVQDSTNILLWLERHRAPFDLLPTAPALREEVLAIEERFDHVGKHVLRVAYDEALARPQAVVDMWTARSNPLEKAALRLARPLVAPLVRRRFRLSRTEVARSRGVLDEAFGWLDDRLSDDRRYLAGEKLTVADITAAALLAPICCPDEHPLYGTAAYRGAVGAVASHYAPRRATAWVRQLYRTARAPEALRPSGKAE